MLTLLYSLTNSYFMSHLLCRFLVCSTRKATKHVAFFKNITAHYAMFVIAITLIVFMQSNKQQRKLKKANDMDGSLKCIERANF